MKNRQGFVSNSSSSSFCIYGTEIPSNYKEQVYNALSLLKAHKSDEFDQLIKDMISDGEGGISTYYERYKEFLDNIDNKSADDIDENFFERLVSCIGLEYVYGPEDMFIGRSWCTVGDDETGLQFKQMIDLEVHKWFPTACCGSHEDAWMDN